MFSISKSQRDFHEFSVNLYPTKKHACTSPTSEHIIVPHYTTNVLHPLYPLQMLASTLPLLTFEQLNELNELHNMLKNHHESDHVPGYDARYNDINDEFIDDFIDGLSHDDIDTF